MSTTRTAKPDTARSLVRVATDLHDDLGVFVETLAELAEAYPTGSVPDALDGILAARRALRAIRDGYT